MEGSVLFGSKQARGGPAPEGFFAKSDDPIPPGKFDGLLHFKAAQALSDFVTSAFW